MLGGAPGAMAVPFGEKSATHLAQSNLVGEEAGAPKFTYVAMRSSSGEDAASVTDRMISRADIASRAFSVATTRETQLNLRSS